MRPIEADLAKLRQLIRAAGDPEELTRWIEVVRDTKTDNEAVIAYEAHAEWPVVLAENKARNEARCAQEAELDAHRRIRSSRPRGRPRGGRFDEVDHLLLQFADVVFAMPKRRDQ